MMQLYYKLKKDYIYIKKVKEQESRKCYFKFEERKLRLRSRKNIIVWVVV